MKDARWFLVVVPWPLAIWPAARRNTYGFDQPTGLRRGQSVSGRAHQTGYVGDALNLPDHVAQ